MRKTEPARASPARSYSLMSVSRTTTPSPVPGSYDLITPCMFVRTRSLVGDLLYLAGLDATRAGMKPPGAAAEGCPHSLNVRIPTALGLPVRVADGITEAGFFAANFADRCHWSPYTDRGTRGWNKATSGMESSHSWPNRRSEEVIGPIRRLTPPPGGS